MIPDQGGLEAKPGVRPVSCLSEQPKASMTNQSPPSTFRLGRLIYIDVLPCNSQNRDNVQLLCTPPPFNR